MFVREVIVIIKMMFRLLHGNENKKSKCIVKLVLRPFLKREKMQLVMRNHQSINQGLFSIQTSNNNNIHTFVYMNTMNIIVCLNAE